VIRWARVNFQDTQERAVIKNPIAKISNFSLYISPDGELLLTDQKNGLGGLILPGFRYNTEENKPAEQAEGSHYNG